MRRLMLLLLLMLLPSASLCEDAPSALPTPQASPVPLTLPSATSAEEVEGFLLMPSKYAVSGVERGYIRYIAQNEERDSAFRKRYWLGGEEGSPLDLTLKERYGVPYKFHAGVMCSRASYSMALSYLGVDLTPGDMSAMMNARNLDEPYDMISWQLGIERIKGSSKTFNAMVDNYLTDPSYSPVYVYFRRPDGSCHSVLVVAKIPDKGRFLVVDSNPIQSGGKLYRVYFISFNKARTEILNSTFRKELQGSEILQIYQWRLPEDASAGESP